MRSPRDFVVVRGLDVIEPVVEHVVALEIV